MSPNAATPRHWSRSAPVPAALPRVAVAAVVAVAILLAFASVVGMFAAVAAPRRAQGMLLSSSQVSGRNSASVPVPPSHRSVSGPPHNKSSPS